jgi:hypothetical protein
VSSSIYLVVETIIRTAKYNNKRFAVHQSSVPTKSYADDITIIGSSVHEIQGTPNVNHKTETLMNGKSSLDIALKLGYSHIRALSDRKQESYLGTQLGS